MPDLSFEVVRAEAVPFSAAPLLTFKLRITNADADELIQSVALRAQIQIDTTHRKYAPAEQQRLLDLFGAPERWSRTLRSMLWTHANVMVPPFKGGTEIDLPVPCTFDFNVAATKYFGALEEGEVPLNLMFSGTVFYAPVEADSRASLQVEQIPWDREAKYRMPVSVWRQMMDIYYPNIAWLCLHRDVFNKLLQFKMDRGIPTWEQALESLLPVPEAAVRAQEEEIIIEGSVPS